MTDQWAVVDRITNGSRIDFVVMGNRENPGDHRAFRVQRGEVHELRLASAPEVTRGSGTTLKLAGDGVLHTSGFGPSHPPFYQGSPTGPRVALQSRGRDVAGLSQAALSDLLDDRHRLQPPFEDEDFDREVDVPERPQREPGTKWWRPQGPATDVVEEASLAVLNAAQVHLLADPEKSQDQAGLSTLLEMRSENIATGDMTAREALGQLGTDFGVTSNDLQDAVVSAWMANPGEMHALMNLLQDSGDYKLSRFAEATRGLRGASIAERMEAGRAAMPNLRDSGMGPDIGPDFG
jgi:hypothetical protein